MCKEFGFQSIKLKGGVFEPRIEVDSMFALREAFGSNVPLRVDPNAIWEVETAIKYGRKMEHILEYLEDPVRGQENMARVRKELNIPFATNMCTTSFEDIPRSIQLGSEDIILSDHHFWGGLRASITLSGICETFGRGLSMHSNSHLGISLAAMVHLGGALPQVPYALDTHYPWQSDEIIMGGRMKFENGSVAVPTGPGLGVELDREALKALHQNFPKGLFSNLVFSPSTIFQLCHATRRQAHTNTSTHSLVLWADSFFTKGLFLDEFCTKLYTISFFLS